jgi:hypothetical protein
MPKCFGRILQHITLKPCLNEARGYHLDSDLNQFRKFGSVFSRSGSTTHLHARLLRIHCLDFPQYFFDIS